MRIAGQWVAQLITTEWGLKLSRRCKYIRMAEAETPAVAEKNAGACLGAPLRGEPGWHPGGDRPINPPG